MNSGMCTLVLIISLLLLTLTNAHNNGLWESCTDSDMSNCISSEICENEICVNDKYQLTPIRQRAIALKDGDFHGLFLLTDGNQAPRAMNLSILERSLNGLTEGFYDITSGGLNSIIAYDVHLLVDVSASIYNETSLDRLQDLVDGLASDMFSIDRSIFLSVHAFAGMEDYITLAKHVKSSDFASKVFSSFRSSEITDEATNLFQSVTKLAHEIIVGADELPNEMTEPEFIAPILIIVTDGKDTASRGTSSEAASAVKTLEGFGGFSIAIPNPEVSEYEIDVLQAFSTFALNYSNVESTVKSGTAIGKLAFSIPMKYYDNAGVVYYCPQQRSGSATLPISMKSGERIEFSNVNLLSHPQCGNVYGGEILESFSVAENIELQCISDSYTYICGLHNGVYCGSCKGNNVAVSLTEGTTYSSSGIYRFSSNTQSSVSVNFKNTGTKEMGYKVYAKKGSEPTNSSYTFYAPEAKLVETKDKCKSCEEEVTYNWEMPCSSNVDLKISNIKPQDEWYLLVESCEVYDPQPASKKPDNSFTPSVLQDLESNAYVLSISISKSGLSSGGIVGITIGAIVAAILIAFVIYKICSSKGGDKNPEYGPLIPDN